MVWPKQWVRQLLVQERPVRQLRHTTTSATATAGFASTTYWQPNTSNPPCGNTGPAGNGWPQGCSNNYASSSATTRRHRGRATHDCPTWFAPDSPLYPLQHGQGQQLRTAADEDVPVQGHKWVFMHNINKQTLVVPFYVCNVTQPIMSVTRLAEQGFSTQLNETPRITHSKGFNSTLKQREGLYFLPVTLVALPANMRLEVNQTAEGTTARVTPVTLTPAGMEILRNRNDLWTFNCRNFLVRVHRTHRKALFMPDNNCPVPTERLENNRRTVIQRPNDNTEVLKETYQDLDKKQQKEGHPRAQLDRRNMVQSETGNTPSRQHTAPPALPSATEQTQTTAQQATSGKPPAVTSTNVPAYRKEASHWSETNRISNGPDTASNNSNSTSKGSESNTGLLVQGRSILETRTRPAKKELVHPATNRCCTRCGNADNM